MESSYFLNILKPYGEISTRVLTLQDATILTEVLASKTKKWTDIIHRSEDFYDIHSTSTPKADVTSFFEATEPLANTQANRSTDLPISNSLFSEGSNIIMLWTYDVEAIDGVSLTASTYLIEDLMTFSPTMGQEPPWFHIWEYSLLNSNITLLMRLEELLTEAQEMARLKKDIFTYTLATKHLIQFADFLQHMDATQYDSITVAPEKELKETSTDNFFFVNYGNDRRNVIEKRIERITYCIIDIVKQWQLGNEIMIAQVREMNSLFIQLQELWTADGHLFDYDDTSYLRINIMETCNLSSDILKDLSMYTIDLYREVIYAMHISFFKQLNQFIAYSISVLETFSDISKANSFTYENSTIGIVTSSTVNTLDDEYGSCDNSFSLYCVVKQLVEDLNEARDNCCVGNDDYVNISMTSEKVFGVDEFEVKFKFSKLRMTAYDLWKSIGAYNFSLDDIPQVLGLLKEAQQISGNLTQKLAAEAEPEDQIDTTTGKSFTKFLKLNSNFVIITYYYPDSGAYQSENFYFMKLRRGILKSQNTKYMSSISPELQVNEVIHDGAWI